MIRHGVRFCKMPKEWLDQMTSETYKIINKLDVTPELHSKYDDSCLATGRKCQGQVGTYFHLLLSCLMITFWPSIQREIQKCLDIRIQLNPKQCILGVSSMSDQKAKLLNIMFYTALLAILHLWLLLRKNYQIFPYEMLSNLFHGTLTLLNSF